MFLCFLHFFISFKYDFHNGAERIMVKKTNVWHDGRIADILGYGHLN